MLRGNACAEKMNRRGQVCICSECALIHLCENGIGGGGWYWWDEMAGGKFVTTYFHMHN